MFGNYWTVYVFSPSVIGMLWNVTSLDADNMARAMFNIWLPGSPIDLQSKSKYDLM